MKLLSRRAPSARWPQLTAICTTAALTAAGLTTAFVTAGPVAAQGLACSASYVVTSQWSGGFNWTVTVTDTGSTAITGWTVTWSYANGQSVANPYNANVTQSGANVTATNMSYNGNIAAGGNTQFGGGGSWSGSNNVPTPSCVPAGTNPTTTTTGQTTTTAQQTTTTAQTTTTGPTTSTTGLTTTTAGGGGSGTGAGYWHTSGNQILDSNNKPVRIAGINWYGFETPDEVVHGLWAQDYHVIINTIANLGYNTIRLPYSNQMVESPIVPQGISFYNNSGPINTDLQGLNSMQIMQKVVDYATSIGLKVILDQHREEAGESAEADGLWYASGYTTQQWVDDWVTLAKLYANNPGVIGADLHNEPHTPAGDTYSQGAMWGGGGPNDWVAAAEQAGNAILAVDPNWLIFVEGIGENPVTSSSQLPPGETGNTNSTWWGGDLELAGSDPVVLNVPNRLVYSAHDYGPSLFQQTWFNSSTTPATLDSTWDTEWGYLDNQGIAPVWVGEFGTDNTASDVQSASAGSQGQWFQSLVSYIAAHAHMSWTYWALNGEDSFALLDNNYDSTPVSALKQSMLQSIEDPFRIGTESGPSGGGTTTTAQQTTTTAQQTTTTAQQTTTTAQQTTTTAQQTTTTARQTTTTGTTGAGCTASYAVRPQWQNGGGSPGGFTATVTVTAGSQPLSSWTVTWIYANGQTVSSAWNATVTQSGASVTASSTGANGSLAAGASTSFGFQGTWNGTTNAVPALTCS